MNRRLPGVISALGLVVFGLAAFSGTPAHASTVPTTSLGIYTAEEDSTGAYSTVSGQSPDVANYYLHWGQGWPSTFISEAEAAGATPYVEIEPWDAGPSWDETPSFQNITANGDSADDDCSLNESTYDTSCATWLADIGSDIASLGKPVILTFAHEFNVSGQYPWSEGDTGSCVSTTACTPAQWIAAWDEVRSVVNAKADGDAYWMWAPNANTGGSTENPSAYWPGASEVDMVGVDGYPQSQYNLDTFTELFGTTFSEIKALSGESTIAQPKIFISETNLAPLDTSPYESITDFVDDLFADGGDGVLEFEADGEPTMTSAQWTELDNALAASTGTGTGTTCSYTGAPETGPDPVTATTSGSTLTVSFPAVGGSTEYEYDVTGPDSGLKADPTISATSDTFQQSVTGDSGYVKVRAENCYGAGPWSATKTWSFSS
jgi:hypothetical protein